jgi:lysophospholipase L1-like esterase
MLKETGNFYWNINFNIQSYEIIINDLQEINIDKTIPKQFYIARDIINFKDTFDKFLNYFKGKKLIFISHLAIKDNTNEEIINNYVNKSRLKQIDFLKEIIPTKYNCYFFENYVTNDLLKDDNHLNSYGYEKVGEKIEEFLKKIC